MEKYTAYEDAPRDLDREPSLRDHIGVLALMALSLFVLTVDLSVIGVALPSIGQNLHATPDLLSWVPSATALTYAGFLILGGKLTDILGQRRCLYVGLSLFGAASLLSSVSPNIWLLISARTMQGLGAAFVAPASFSLINTLIPEGPLRHRALGVYGVTQGISVVFGLVLGGFIVTAFGWRAIFLMNLPILAVLLALVHRLIPEGPRSPKIPSGSAVCSAIIAIATAIFVLALSIVARQRALSVEAIFCFLGALLGYGIFFLFDKQQPTPLVPANLYSAALFRGCVGGMGLLAGFSGLLLISNLYMQRGLGFSAALSGLGMLPYALAVIVASNAMPALLKRLRPRTAAGLGFAVNIVGMLLLADAVAASRYNVVFLIGLVLAPFGSLLAFLATMADAAQAAPYEQQGLVSGALFMFHQVGIAIGSAVCLSVMSWVELGAVGAEHPNYVGAYVAAVVMVALGATTLLKPDRREPELATSDQGLDP